MIGIFCIISSFVTDIVHAARKGYYEQGAKLNANPIRRTYLDYEGVERDVNTDHPVDSYVNPKSRDVILVDCKTGDKRNISEINRMCSYEDKRKKASEKGKTVVCWNNCDRHSEDSVTGVRYRDIETGKLMVIKQIGGVYWYVDARTGKIIRKSDGQIRWDNLLSERTKRSGVLKRYKTDEQAAEFIELYNSGNSLCKAFDVKGDR